MAKKEKAKAEKAEATEFKYGVQDLADALGIKAASVRVQLRNKGIEKAGKSYGWNSKKELNEVIDQIRSDSNDDGDDAEEEKASKKASKKKASKKSAKKAKKSKKVEDDEDEDEDDE